LCNKYFTVFFSGICRTENQGLSVSYRSGEGDHGNSIFNEYISAYYPNYLTIQLFQDEYQFQDLESPGSAIACQHFRQEPGNPATFFQL
jgi:hypothetical protein